jgi:hypothetical protein
MSTTTKQPTHRAFAVRKNGEKSFWSQIGAAWPHQDGKGLSVQLFAMPVDGKVVLRVTSLLGGAFGHASSDRM